MSMEGVRAFLEASTIHGLTYISTTRKYARLFWIFVVLTGFLGAIMLIKESFDSWSESPVKTTIETLPIAEIKLPKVTVCPPKKTFTDLNYDLMMTENMTLTEEMRNEMFKYALEVIDEKSFSFNNWTKLQAEEKFYNWYHGFTQIESPVYDKDDRLKIEIYTSATSGVVTTQYYEDPFRPELVERKLMYRVNVYPPESVMNNKNVTLHFKVEKVSMSMTGMDSGSKETVLMGWTWGSTEIAADQTIAYKNFTPSDANYIKRYYMDLERDVSPEDVEIQTLDTMPGLRFSWWYTGAEVTPVHKYKDEDITKQFVR